MGLKKKGRLARRPGLKGSVGTWKITRAMAEAGGEKRTQGGEKEYRRETQGSELSKAPRYKKE